MDDQTQNPKQALTDKLKDCKNVLVTVSNNPNVDQLAACLGLTLWLNKIEKHATAVFSGEVPSTLEFLQPADTLEKNTDSLRDFIISLDKTKADKLRYKVEDSVVKVFVTPYRTSLTAADLEFSQGDFNVDMVIALGVHKQEDLDAAITAHGRILHDAVVITITIGDDSSELGSINWHDQQASSLSELVVELANSIDQPQIDSQIATALLTGVVAETERFSNDKTTPQTMSVSAQLMSAGANQQLVATKLEAPAPVPVPAEPVVVEEPVAPVINDGSLSIEHEENTETPAPEVPAEPVEEPAAEPEQPAEPEVQPESQPEALEEPAPEASETPELSDEPIMEHGANDLVLPDATQMQPAPPDWMPQQPWMDATPTVEQPAADFSGLPVSDEVTSNDTPAATDLPELVADQPVDQPVDLPVPEVAPEPVAEPEQVTEPEAAPEVQPEDAADQDTANLDAARDEVLRAINAEPEAPASLPEAPVPPEAPVSTDFIPANFNVINDPEAPQLPTMPELIADPNMPADPTLTGPVDQPFTLPSPPPSLTPPPANPVPPTSVEFDPTAPPPVPPPMPFGK